MTSGWLRWWICNIAEHTLATLQPLVYQPVARCVKSWKKTSVALIQLGDGVAFSAIPVAFVHGFINQELGVVQRLEFSMRILAGYNVEEVLFWVPFRVSRKKTKSCRAVRMYSGM